MMFGISRRFPDRTLERRLELDANGPPVHISYYRQDAADALVEIRRLRALVNFLASGATPAGKGETG